MIGEIGAKNLDLAEESSYRVNNLIIAKEMEKMGKTPMEIKLATGWERGASNGKLFSKGNTKDVLLELEKEGIIKKIDC